MHKVKSNNREHNLKCVKRNRNESSCLSRFSIELLRFEAYFWCLWLRKWFWNWKSYRLGYVNLVCGSTIYVPCRIVRQIRTVNRITSRLVKFLFEFRSFIVLGECRCWMIGLTRVEKQQNKQHNENKYSCGYAQHDVWKCEGREEKSKAISRIAFSIVTFSKFNFFFLFFRLRYFVSLDGIVAVKNFENDKHSSRR